MSSADKFINTADRVVRDSLFSDRLDDSTDCAIFTRVSSSVRDETGSIERKKERKKGGKEKKNVEGTIHRESSFPPF